MPSQLNETIVNEYRGLLANVSSCLLVDYQGLSPAQATSFRLAFREKSLQVEVVRNALAAIVIKEKGYPELDGMLSGPTALIFNPRGQSDESTIAAAKAFADWKKKAGMEKPSLKGALFEGQILDSKRAEGLAKMPGRAEVLGMIVSQILGPGRRLAGAILAAGSNVSGAVKAYVDKLEKASQDQEGGAGGS